MTLKKISILLGALFLAVLLYQSARVLHARSVVQERFASVLDVSPTALSLIAEERIAQLIKIEDPEFYTHDGVDFKTAGAGVTTIPQALAKRLFFKEFTPGWRKIEQTLIARFAISPFISKEDQLAAFLEAAYLGRCNTEPVIGFSAAAQCYYGKPLFTLTDDEFLGLAAMLIGPNRYHPVNNPQQHFNRVARIKNYLSDTCAPTSNSDVYYEACKD